MENIKENIKELERIGKENYKINEEIKKLNEIDIYLKYKENKEEFIKYNNKIKQLKNKIKLNQVKKAILKNNLHYLLKMDFEGIKENIIKYYEKGGIGEKTKEKIQNEINNYYYNNYNIKIHSYISFESFNNRMNIDFIFLNNEGYKSFILEYKEDFKISIEKNKYNNDEIEILYYNNIIEYIFIKNINSRAKEYLQNYNKTIEKLEKLKTKQRELYHDFTDYLHGFLYEELKINTDISIY